MPDVDATVEDAPEAVTGAVESETAAPATTTPDNGSEATPEPFWRDDWRERMAGSDEKMLKHLNRFASPEGVYKSWRQYERQRNDGRLVPTKPDNGDEKALAEWRSAVGAPDSPDGYLDSLPEDVQISDGDKAALSRVFSKMHEDGISKKQAASIVGEYYKMQSEANEYRAEQDRQYKLRSEDSLREEWGSDFRSNLNSIGLLMESHGSPELFGALQDARFSDGTKVADNPEVLKFLVGLAREAHPDVAIDIPTISGISRSDAVADEIAKLEQEMRDTRGRDPGGYWNSEQKQSRYRELLQARERMTAKGR